MKKLQKLSERGLALFIALVMCLSLVQVTAFAEDAGYAELTCGKEAHTHTGECYGTVETQDLICPLEEAAGHVHADGCFSEDGALICEIAEAEGHTHEDACWQTTQTRGELLCTIEEHEHTEACYAAQEAPEPEVCVCEIRCGGDHVNAACPVCIADPAACVGAEVREEVPAEVQAFLDAVAALETADPADAQTYALLGQAAMDAYEAIQSVGLESYEGVPEALSALMAVAKQQTGGNTLEEDGVVSVATYDELKKAIQNAGTTPTTIKLTQDIDATDYIQILNGQDITLTAANGAILRRAENSVTSILVYAGSKFTLESIVVDGNSVSTKFAMVYIYAGGSATMKEGSVLQNCNSSSNGGAVYNAGTFTMTGGTIQKNTATKFGGGVYNNKGTFTMTGGMICDNNSGNLGGGIYSDGGTVSISKAVVSGNSNDNSYGGGMYVKNATSLSITDTTVSRNFTGAIAVNGGSANTLHNVRIVENKGDASALRISGYGAKITIECCVIAENENSNASTDLTASNSTVDVSGATVTILSSKISQNQASLVGGIKVGISGTVNLKNTVVKGNISISDSQYSTGGVFVDTLAKLNFESGALYNNKSGNGNANDLFAYAVNAGLIVMDAINMSDPDVAQSYFTVNNYAWKLGDDSVTYSSIKDLMSNEFNTNPEKSVTAVPTTSAEGIYLDVINGNDENAGTDRSISVKTLAKALELAKGFNNVPVYALTPVTLAGSENTLDGEGITLMRDRTNEGNVLNLASGELTLTNIVIDGASTQEWANKGVTSLVQVSGGKLTLGEGAVLQNNDVSQNSAYLKNYGGGVYVGGGELVIDGGTIQNCTAVQGGGIAVLNGKIVMNKGTLSGNIASGDGGAVLLLQRGQMTMNGGTISGNTADHGGGVSVGSKQNGINYQGKDQYVLEVHGGTFEKNEAKSAGGGIFIQQGDENPQIGGNGYSALIDGNEAPVYIRENKALAHNAFFAGGGIYVNGNNAKKRDGTNIDGYLKLECVEITNNTAGIEGGGLAGCLTSDTSIYLADGSAIYGNMANDVPSDVLADAIDHASGTNIQLPGVAPQINISPYMLGGGAYNWKSVKTGELVPLNHLVGKYTVSLYTDQKAGDRDVLTAKSLARVFITDNYSGTRGGGVGSNGKVEIGQTPDYPTVVFSVTKKWEGDENHQNARPDMITVDVERSTDQQDWEKIGILNIYATQLWTDSVRNLLKKAWGKTDGNVYGYIGPDYTYRVVERPVDGYTSSGVAGSMENGYIITNTLKTYNLTVNYIYEGGGTASPTVTRGDLIEGDTYDVPSPSINGYIADIITVSGEMPAKDVVVTVVYKPNTPTPTYRYRIDHIYYTNGSASSDGSITGAVRETSVLPTETLVTVSDRILQYVGNTYTYTSVSMAQDASGVYVITLRYDRTTGTTPILPPPDPTPPTTIITPDPTPLGPSPDGVTIVDEDVPLAAPGLNSVDHYAYIIGYTDGLVHPEANITRAEVATIFFRLMTDEFRMEHWSTENGFPDVKTGSWYNNGVSTSSKAGIVKGYEDSSFRPDRNITRAEFAAIAARFLSEETTITNSFSDISGHWAEEEINRAVQAGWIKGYTDGTFRPDQPITRAEAVTMINRMLDRTPDKDHLLEDMIRWADNTEDKWYYADMQEATNSHDYERMEMILIEDWTELLENRDWVQLEKEWSTAASAPGAEVADNLDLSGIGESANGEDA